jgi:hypothetical protein
MTTFSRQTILDLIHAHRFRTHAEVEKFALRFSLEGAIRSPWISGKEADIAHRLIENPDAKGPKGAPLVFEIIEQLITDRCGYSLPEECFPDLVNALTRDGFVISDGHLARSLPSEIPVASQQDELVAMLDRFGFETAKGHYLQAVAAHSRGDWAAANSQLRSFIEELFDRIAERLVPGGIASLASSENRRQALAARNVGFFMPALNEWAADGKGFIQGFWRRLHPQGSHPGLSDEQDSSFRLHMVILVAHHYLRRLSERCAP